MLRVGLTGGLGSGKTTVAAIFRRLGAEVMEADTVARAMMQPGEAVYASIVETFGTGVVAADGALDRHRLAEIAFTEGRLAELNAIVHPPVIEAQRQWMERLERERPDAVAIYETALLFEAGRNAETLDWQQRFDCRILVTAPEVVRIARYVSRMGGPAPDAETGARLESEARRRLAAQLPDEEKMNRSEIVIRNDTTLEALTQRTEGIYRELTALAADRAGRPPRANKESTTQP